jgi:hypothetical protein
MRPIHSGTLPPALPRRRQRRNDCAARHLGGCGLQSYANDRFLRHIAIAGCLAAILGAKLLLIARLGIPTPYWDQWDAEAIALYLPYYSGTLGPERWFAFHNEHRLLLTRVNALALLWLSGSWDPVLQMLVNAAIHVGGIALLVVLVGRLLDRASLLLFLAFVTLLFAAPLGWDNTLGGFQIQFYYLILLSLLSLHLLCGAPAWSPRWLIGTLLGIAAYFSMASGALVLPAVVILTLAQRAVGQRAGARELTGMALHIALSFVLLSDALSFSPNADFRAGTIGQLINSILVSASWPIAAASWPTVLRIIPAMLVHLPIMIFAVRFLAQRNGIADRRWFVLALAAWMAVQIFALSYGRVGGSTESRYADIFLIGIALNGAAWLYLMRDVDMASKRRLILLPAIWLLAVMLGAGQKATSRAVDGIAARYATGLIQTENVKGFLATGDFAHLAGKPLLHIPYPSAERLHDLLSDPKLRAILPAALTGAPERNRVKLAILRSGPLLLPLGLALLLIAAAALCLRRENVSADPPQAL